MDFQSIEYEIPIVMGKVRTWFSRTYELSYGQVRQGNLYTFVSYPQEFLGLGKGQDSQFEKHSLRCLEIEMMSHRIDATRRRVRIADQRSGSHRGRDVPVASGKRWTSLFLAVQQNRARA